MPTGVNKQRDITHANARAVTLELTLTPTCAARWDVLRVAKRASKAIRRQEARAWRQSVRAVGGWGAVAVSRREQESLCWQLRNIHDPRL